MRGGDGTSSGEVGEALAQAQSSRAAVVVGRRRRDFCDDLAFFALRSSDSKIGSAVISTERGSQFVEGQTGHEFKVDQNQAIAESRNSLGSAASITWEHRSLPLPTQLALRQLARAARRPLSAKGSPTGTAGPSMKLSMTMNRTMESTLAPARFKASVRRPPCDSANARCLID